MKKLDELIQEFCPDGVNHIAIGQLIKQKCIITITPSIKIKRNDYLLDGAIPIISQEAEYISGYCNLTDKNIPKDNYVCFGDHSEHIKFIDFAFVQGADGLKIMRTDETVLSARYLFHAALNFYCRHNNYERHFKYFTDTIIPLPPLAVQQEIVRILDSFTELTAELTAELTVRRKQYEHYRDELFNITDCEYLHISDIADTNIGLATSVTKYKASSGVLLLHNSDIQQNRIVLKAIEYIEKWFAEKNQAKILQPEDIITVHTGDVGTSAVITEKYAGAIGFTTITTRIKNKNIILPHFLCHYLNSQKCKADIATMTISDRSNLNQKSYEKLLIPIPSVKRQLEIISILDSFNIICNDLASGLPAEIAARQKQYEYYRNKLLTFKVLEG